jgi:hypothetical protein
MSPDVFPSEFIETKLCDNSSHRVIDENSSVIPSNQSSVDDYCFSSIKFNSDVILKKLCDNISSLIDWEVYSITFTLIVKTFNEIN